jgi:hypothetical protein
VATTNSFTTTTSTSTTTIRREMKAGLKLLTELNTLVWTSKAEAEVAMKDAAAKARAAELAAATAAAASKDAEAAAAAAGDSTPVGQNLLHALTFGWLLGSRTRAAAAEATGSYQPLPSADPEAGGAGWAAGSNTTAGSAKQQPGRVSQLTRALLHGGGGSSSSRSRQPQQHAAPADPSSSKLPGCPSGWQGEEEEEARAAALQQFQSDYEERCEGVLTRVYQSMFKVKETVVLAESEVRVGCVLGQGF